MNKIYVVFQDGQEDPLCVCASEDLAERAIKQVEAIDMLELGRVNNTWFEPMTVITSVSQIKDFFFE